MKWLIAACLMGMSTVSFADDPQGDLIASFVALRNATQNGLDSAKQRCADGRQKECESALVWAALLGTIDAEIALNRLKGSVRDGDASEKLQRALRNLDDAETAINRAKEALDKAR
jgi:hypothetical protein